MGRDWGKKLAAEKEKLLKHLVSRTRIKKTDWGKVTQTFNLLLFSVFGDQVGVLLTLTHPSSLQCSFLSPPSSCSASFSNWLGSAPSLYQVPAARGDLSHCRGRLCSERAVKLCREWGQQEMSTRTTWSLSHSNCFAVLSHKWAKQTALKNCLLSEHHWLPSTEHILL